MTSKGNIWLSNSTNNSSISDTFQLIGGIYLTLTMVVSIVLNGLLLLVLIRFEKMRTSLNNVIIVITVFNLFGCIQFPALIYSHFVHK